MESANSPSQNAPSAADGATIRRSIGIGAGGVTLEGDLVVPADPKGIVLFAHGSGSSRHSSRNRYVASALNGAGFGTLLLDLLTRQEEIDEAQTGHLRFDIAFLAERLVYALKWLRAQPETAYLPAGLFGASTGAGAALVAASEFPDGIRAVVSRGGRPDLAGDFLLTVQAPTLLIVGGNDIPVIELNKLAMERLRTEHKLVIVPGATHLFEEPGTLEQVAHLAGEWFSRHLSGTPAPAQSRGAG